MIKNLILSFFFSIIVCVVSAQTIVHGFVRDSFSREALISATIVSTNESQDKIVSASLTDNEGFFSIPNSEVSDSLILQISYIGYASQVFKIKPNDSLFTLLLTPKNTLSSVVIKATNLTMEQRNEMSTIELPVSQIKTLPRLFGEADVVRALQLMPGVQGGREGTSGLYVRGGTPDQNLFLIDDVPIYYINHVGGFVSVFDANALNTVKLYKGGFPAKFGGRLSAIVDMRLREGNRKDFKGEYGLGILSSQVFVEGPIRFSKSKDIAKTSFLLSARRSNIDLFSRLYFLLQSPKTSGAYVFYDITGKVTHHFSEKDKLTTSIYWGTDRVESNSADEYSDPLTKKTTTTTNTGGLDWGNIGVATRFSHVYNANLTGSLLASYTQFQYAVAYKGEERTDNEFKKGQFGFRSTIRDVNLKANFDYTAIKKHRFNGGLNLIFHTFTPGVQTFLQVGNIGKDVDSTFNNTNLNALETNAYIEDEWSPIGNLTFVAGLHQSIYLHPDTVIIAPQPRFLMNWNFVKGWAFKTSVTRMQQHLHLLSNSGAGLPTDIWVPATRTAPSESSWQYALGISHTFKNLGIEFSIEGYYKTMQNLLEFKDGASFFTADKNWEQKVERGGIARCYGLEIFLQKKEGNTTGWIAYTLSKNERQFSTINNGNWYPYKYDQTHNLAIVLQHQFNKKYGLSGSWVYNTGNALTLPIGRAAQAAYPIDTYWNIGYVAPQAGFSYPDAFIFEGKNNFRMPDYHRLDLALTITTKNTKNRLITWNIGAYNAYSRENPYYLYYDKNAQGKTSLFQYSLFPIIPFVHYTCKFK